MRTVRTIACLILAGATLLVAPAGPVGAVSGGKATAGPASVVRQAPAAKLPRRPAGIAHDAGIVRKAPRTPVDPDAPVSHREPSDPTAAPAQDGSHAPADFATFVLTDLGTGSGAGTAALVPEPSVASDGIGVLEAWNWYAAASIDGGQTFGYMDPFTMFPWRWRGFCCDQVVTYDPSRDLYIWALMYVPTSRGNNGVRIAVAHGDADLAGGIWQWWDLTPRQVGAKRGTSYDQPKIALSDNFLYVEAARFDAFENFRRSTVMRLPLDTLDAGGMLDYDYFNTKLFSPGPVVGATDTMYLAAHVDNHMLRMFTWPEGVGPGGVTTSNVTHASYPQNYPYRCPRIGGTSASNWCRRSDDRIIAGVIHDGVMAFSWNASQGNGGLGSFPYPYVHVVLIDEASMAVLGQPQIWNAGFAFNHAALSANAESDLGGSVMFGGGSTFESCAPLLNDEYTGGAWFLPFGLFSDTDPNRPVGGDYLSSYPNGGNTQTWSATCYTIEGGGADENVHPWYVAFGREEDAP